MRERKICVWTFVVRVKSVSRCGSTVCVLVWVSIQRQTTSRNHFSMTTICSKNLDMCVLIEEKEEESFFFFSKFRSNLNKLVRVENPKNKVKQSHLTSTELVEKMQNMTISMSPGDDNTLLKCPLICNKDNWPMNRTFMYDKSRPKCQIRNKPKKCSRKATTNKLK